MGWRCTVIAPRETAYRATDPDLVAQIPESTRVIRTRFFNTKRHLGVAGRYPAMLAIPDVWAGWYLWAVPSGKRAIREDPPDLVFSTSPHGIAHVIAGRLARWGRLPWVMDFRDPWYEEPPEPETPYAVHVANRRLERKAVRQANRVIATTESHRNALAERYGEEPHAKFVTITNGYDEADFADLAEEVGVKAPVGTEAHRMVILHAGKIDVDYRRDPRPLVRSLEELSDKGELPDVGVELQFLGPGNTPFAQTLREEFSGYDEGPIRIVFIDRVGYRESLRRMLDADLLLLLEASEDTRMMVPAKLYEYLRTGRPILLMAHPGAMAEVVAKTGGAWLADPRTEGELTEQLREILGLWERGTLHENGADQRILATYDRRNLAGRLATVFEEVIRCEETVAAG